MTLHLCVTPAPAVDVTYLVDTLVPGTVHRPLRALRRAGGKGFNVARTLAILGGRARVLGPVGGAQGRWLVRAAAEDGVDFVPTTQDGVETRTCVSVCCVDGSPPTDLYETAPSIGDQAWRALVAGLASRDAESVTVLSGSLPADAEEAHLDALAEAARPGRMVVDMHGPVVAGWLGSSTGLDLLKVNLDEAAALLGLAAPQPDERDAVLEVVRGLRALSGARLVVVTLGRHGAVALDASGAAGVGAPPEGPFPVGSGDAFLAGLLHGLGDDWGSQGALHESLRLAAATGAANAQELGAGSVDLARVRSALATVRAEPM